MYYCITKSEVLIPEIPTVVSDDGYERKFYAPNAWERARQHADQKNAEAESNLARLALAEVERVFARVCHG